MDHREARRSQFVAGASAAVSLGSQSVSSGCDLDSRSQIHNAVVSFYRDLIMDDLLGPVFEEVAEVDWSTHIPLLIDYWCRVLLGHQNYQGTILGAHRRVHELQPLTADLFDRWYGLWMATDRPGVGRTVGREGHGPHGQDRRLPGSSAPPDRVGSLMLPHPSRGNERLCRGSSGRGSPNDQSAPRLMGILRHELLH